MIERVIEGQNKTVQPMFDKLLNRPTSPPPPKQPFEIKHARSGCRRSLDRTHTRTHSEHVFNKLSVWCSHSGYLGDVFFFCVLALLFRQSLYRQMPDWLVNGLAFDKCKCMRCQTNCLITCATPKCDWKSDRYNQCFEMFGIVCNSWSS